MRLLFRNWVLLGLFIASTVAGIFYFHYRGSVFRTPLERNWLTYQFSNQEIADFIAPFDVVNPSEITYSTETFVDRNAVKYVEKTAKEDQFENAISLENIPLWGWIIHVDKPISVVLKISHVRQLIGIGFLNPSQNRVIAYPNLVKLLEENLGKKFSTYKSEIFPVYNDLQKFRFEKRIADTDLLERITLTLDHGRFRNIDSNLFLPQTYADDANHSIEKQKTLHLFFNLFNYLLIGLVFLTLFHVHETKKLLWKRSFVVFMVYFCSQFVAYLFQSSFHHHTAYVLFQTFLRTLSETIWIYLLIVIADFVSRTTQRMPHSLLDITRKSFLVSKDFRNSLVIGWGMAIIQVIFVWNFYKILTILSAYVPLKIPGEHSQFCTVQFLQYFSDSLSTAMREEILYRLFFIGLFISIFRRATLAIIFSSILWGFLHFSYQFEPYYVRGIELSLIGFFYGWMMVRYGIVSVLVAHFVYNSFILSEYEFQSSGYLLGVNVALGALCFFSYLFRNSTQPFEVEHEEFPSIRKKIETFTERRSIYERIYPVNSKYIWASLVVLCACALWYPIRQHMNPSVQSVASATMSGDLVSNYTDITQTWDVTYYRENAMVERLKTQAEKLDAETKRAINNDLKNQSNLITIRYFSKGDDRVICDFDFTSSEELTRMNCPNVKVESGMGFDTDQWLRSFRPERETWTLLDEKTTTAGREIYLYRVVDPTKKTVHTTVTLSVENNHVIQFKKESTIDSIQAPASASNISTQVILIALSAVGIIFLICFLRLFIQVAKIDSLYERKSIVGAAITMGMWILWALNSYKRFLIEFDSSMTLRHFLTNQILYQLGLLMSAGFAAYIIFYAFFHFPSFVYRNAPTTEQWNGILSRPIWKWRNAKSSLLYSLLLICIQTFLSLFIQITDQTSDVDLFHFDVGYLNHDYLLITFVGLVWKYLLFWMLLLVIITSLEKYIRRRIYLSIIAISLFLNAILFQGVIGPKLIELASVYIVFYFIYRVVRFDFAFYGWFIVLNALFTFLPILFHSEYQIYSQQIYALVILITAIAIFTLYRNNKTPVESWTAS